MPLITLIAGPYTSTYDPPGATLAATLGIMEDGFQLQYRRLSETIQRTDSYGMTPLDAVHLGAECFLAGVALEYGKVNLHAALFPMHATEFTPTGVNSLKLGQVGILDSGRAGTLVLTSTAGTPAAASPTTLTATTNVILAENFDVGWLFGPAYRKIPWRFRLYPYDVGAGVNGFFTTT